MAKDCWDINSHSSADTLRQGGPAIHRSCNSSPSPRHDNSRSRSPHTRQGCGSTLGLIRGLRRFDTRVGLGPGSLPAHLVPMPTPIAGTAWWQMRVWRACEHFRHRLPLRPGRPMICESLFGGTLSEGFSDKTLGIESIIQAYCDAKRIARKFVLRSHSDMVQHMFSNAKHMMADWKRDLCLTCLQGCQGRMARPDLTLLGAPCQLVTRSRHKTGTGDSGFANQHRQWHAVF